MISGKDTSRKLRSVLVGEVRTAEYALRGLLQAGMAPLAVVTTPIDKVQRTSGMETDYYCDLVSLGAANHVPAIVSEDLNSQAGALQRLHPDCIWVMGWPYLVREPILDLAPCIGMHPTALPRRRGGAPMNWTLLDGEVSSAVTLFRLQPGVDDGPILAQETFHIGWNDYVSDVAAKIYDLTEKLVQRSALALAADTAVWTPQADSEATYTRRRTPEDGRINWNDSSVRIRNLVRATSHPFPGAFTNFHGTPVRVWGAELPLGFRAPLKAPPGRLLELLDEGLVVSTRDNALLITELQFGDDEALTSSLIEQQFRHHLGELFS
jgi:methionyl-tRNA formyltransferase